MAYLDKNGLNYFSVKVKSKINDVNDKIENLRIVGTTEEKSIVTPIYTGTGYYIDNHLHETRNVRRDNDQCQYLVYNVSEGGTFIIHGYSSESTPSYAYTQGQPAYLFPMYKDYVLQTWVTLYTDEDIYSDGIQITTPLGTNYLLIQSIDYSNYPPYLEKVESIPIKIDRLADAAPMDSDVSSMLLEVFNNALTPQELEDLVFLSNVESEVF